MPVSGGAPGEWPGHLIAHACGPRRTLLQSNAQRRGVKVFGGQPVKAGGIIVRQVGSEWHDGTNTALGKDYTLFSLVDGIVVYDKKKEKPAVSCRAQSERMPASRHHTRQRTASGPQTWGCMGVCMGHGSANAGAARTIAVAPALQSQGSCCLHQVLRCMQCNSCMCRLLSA